MIYILNFYFIEFFSWISNKYFPVEFSVLLPILARRNLEFCFAKLQTTKRAPYLSILYLQSKSGLDILIMVHIHGSTQLENYSKNVSTNKRHNDDHIGATREHLKFNYQPRMSLMQFWLTFILACSFSIVHPNPTSTWWHQKFNNGTMSLLFSSIFMSVHESCGVKGMHLHSSTHPSHKISLFGFWSGRAFFILLRLCILILVYLDILS